MTCGLPTSAVPTSIHCDHLIQANVGAEDDLKVRSRHASLFSVSTLTCLIQHSIENNKEVFDFLESAARKYGEQLTNIPAATSNVVAAL
jgi:homoaconitase